MSIQVILAESRPLVRRAIRSALAHAPDIDVVASAVDEESLLEQVREKRPKVVISNAQMWTPHPIKAVEKIKRACPDTELLVLVDRDRSALVSVFIDAGARGCLFDTDGATLELDTVIHRIAGGENFYSTAVKDQYFRLPRLDLFALTERSLEILLLAAQGYTNNEIAGRLSIKARSVGNALYTAYRRLDLKEESKINKRVLAAILVWQMGLLEK